jgi:hypothetical protein
MSKGIVKLSVGGMRFETTFATLQMEKDSILGLMFGKRWREEEAKMSEDGYVFIDRSGKIFQYILDYLRGSITLPNDR